MEGTAMQTTYSGMVDDGKDRADVYWAVWAAAIAFSIGLLIGVTFF
jgi:hypothetical protein